MGLFDDPVGFLNGGTQGPFGQMLKGLFSGPGLQNYYDPNRSFAQNALDPRGIEQAMNIGMSMGPGAIKTPKLARIDALTADRLAAERSDPSAGSPVNSFSAIQAADQSPRGYEIQKSGQPIGTMEVSFPQDPAHAYVDYLGAWGDGGSSNALGPRAVRDVGRQFFQADPAIQSLTGRRVSGARDIPSDVTVTRDQALGSQGAAVDPGIIELIRKYGLAGLTLGGGSAFMSGNQ